MIGEIETEINGGLNPMAERAKKVFRFLAEVKKLASPTVRDFDAYEKVVWFSDIPRDKGCYTKAWAIIGQAADDGRFPLGASTAG